MEVRLYLTLLFFHEINANLHAFPLIINHLNNFNIKMCSFLTCWTKNEEKILAEVLVMENIRYDFPKSTKSIQSSLSEKKSINYLGFVLDLKCENFTKYIHESNVKLNYHWLIFTKSLSTLDDFVIRMDSTIKVAISTTNHTFEIFDIYNPAKHLGKKTVFYPYGFWNGSYLQKTSIQSFYLQRKNMSFIQLRTGSVVLISNHLGSFEEYMLDSRNTQLDTMSKFHYSLFLLLEEMHNFTHSLQIEDKWFGNYQNGTDAGVGKLLFEDKIDVTCTGASQRPPRVDVYDYLMPSYHFRPCYIFRNPGTYNPISDEFLKPFSSTVWYLIIVSSVLITIFLKKFQSGQTLQYSWSAAFLTTVSVIFQQDSSSNPSRIAGRISFLVLQIFSVLLYNYYTSSIISSLLSKPPQAFHSLDELGHSKLEIGIEDLSYTITWFEIMNDSDVQYIYRHKVFPPGAKKLNIYEPEEGVAKVRKGGFAYHTQLDTGYPIIARTFDQDAICDLTEIPMIPQVEAGMMVQKHSQYKELFHISLRRIKEVGLVYKISQIWEANKPECLSSIRVTAVGIEQVFMAFFCLFLGIILALIILGIEVVSVCYGFNEKRFFINSLRTFRK